MRYYSVILILVCSAFAKAQTSRAYSNEFLNIGVDAAALGMSNAVVASTSNVNAGYWNPAGLMQLEEKEISLMHSSYFANIAQYNYGAYAMPIDDQSAIGFSVIRFSVDDILNTTQLIDDQGNINYDRISTFSTADWAVTASYARESKLDGFSYGGNVKIIRRVIGDFASSIGFGIDLGVQLERGKWKFGAMVRDITTTYNTWSIDEDEFATVSDAVENQNQELPETTEITLPKLQLGIAREFVFHYDHVLLAEVDLNMRFIQTNDIFSSGSISATPALGLQYGYTDLVFVRAGVGNFQNVQQLDGNDDVTFQPNIGIGFKYKGISVDYALTDIGDQSAALYSNVFSLNIDLSVFR
ncbi:putative type IX sorting system protein PorV2 [Nonlabens ponticola]|uniref:PorV/PorQ family protein n=1 Tax=Nonlabens ponticola TaxID=2496866 RepID=A0A3S9MX86_9FLAO|nr:PorV/PorQ family protein [Nonlabens ponticola]AZQ43886.1 PorV/PorQ family protein [Nonlabens ponticola]